MMSSVSTRTMEWKDDARYATDGLILICLLASGLRLTTGLEAIGDPGLFDETGYRYAGTHLRSAGLMPPAWAPLYSVWY